MEYDRLVASVGQGRPLCPSIIRMSSSNSKLSVLRRPDFHQLMARHGGDLSCLSQELNATDYDTFALRVPVDRVVNSQAYTSESMSLSFCLFVCDACKSACVFFVVYFSPPGV